MNYNSMFLFISIISIFFSLSKVQFFFAFIHLVLRLSTLRNYVNKLLLAMLFIAIFALVFAVAACSCCCCCNAVASIVFIVIYTAGVVLHIAVLFLQRDV